MKHTTLISDREIAAAEKAIRLARSKLIMGRDARSAFFSRLAVGLTLRHDESIPTMATDGTWLLYNAAFVNALTMNRLIGVVVHEVLHCVFSHMSRRKNRKPKGWNIAADLAINDIVSDSGYELPKGVCIAGEGPFAKLAKRLSAEAYYAILAEQNQDAGDPDKGDDPGGCGGVMDAGDGDPQQGDADGDGSGDGDAASSGTDEAKQSEAEARWKQAAIEAENIAKSRGTLPAGLSRMVHDAVHPKMTIADRLRQFVSTNAKNDYRWSPANRRHIHAGMILPSLRSEELGHVVALFDTSGSIGGPVMQRFADLLQGVLESYDCRLTILYHDTVVAGVQEWSPTDGPLVIEPKGGGGTSHIQPLDQASKIDDAVCIVSLTDGFTVWPSIGPEIPLLIATTTDLTAPFGETVEIGGDL